MKYILLCLKQECEKSQAVSQFDIYLSWHSLAISANFESFCMFIASSPFKPQIDFAPVKAFVINRKLGIRNSGIKHSFLTPAFIQPDIH